MHVTGNVWRSEDNSDRQFSQSTNGSRDQTQWLGLCSKHHYPPNQPIGPVACFERNILSLQSTQTLKHACAYTQ